MTRVAKALPAMPAITFPQGNARAASTLSGFVVRFDISYSSLWPALPSFVLRSEVMIARGATLAVGVTSGYFCAIAEPDDVTISLTHARSAYSTAVLSRATFA